MSIERFHVLLFKTRLLERVAAYVPYLLTAKMSNVQRSDYFMKLDKAAKERYLSKLSVIENSDPYLLKGKDFTEDLAALPPLR